MYIFVISQWFLLKLSETYLAAPSSSNLDGNSHGLEREFQQESSLRWKLPPITLQGELCQLLNFCKLQATEGLILPVYEQITFFVTPHHPFELEAIHYRGCCHSASIMDHPTQRSKIVDHARLCSFQLHDSAFWPDLQIIFSFSYMRVVFFTAYLVCPHATHWEKQTLCMLQGWRLSLARWTYSNAVQFPKTT